MNSKFNFNPLVCFCFGGDGNVEDAQAIANEANLKIAEDYNLTQRELAADANKLNYQMFQEQNAWNREQWRLENDYNSPEKQVERYIKAGINPLWAISNGDPGKAQHLESASSSPAVVPDQQLFQKQPEYDPNAVSNIIAAAQSVVNSTEGFTKLYLEGQDVGTRRAAVDVQRDLANAEIMYKRAQTVGQDIFNNLNTQTFGTQVQIKLAELSDINSRIDNAKKQGKKIDADIAIAQETKNQIVSMTKFIDEQSRSLIDERQRSWKQLYQRDRELSIMQQNADTQSFASQSMSYYQGEELKLKSQEFAFQQEKSRQELNNMSNQQILNWYSEQRGWLDKVAGSFGSAVVGMFPGSDTYQVNEVFHNIKYAGEVLYERCVNNPTDSNIKSYSEYLKSLDSLPHAPCSNSPLIDQHMNFNVLNPPTPWQ